MPDGSASPSGSPTPEETAALAALVRDITAAHGSVTIFAVCEVARQRDRLMDSVQACLPEKQILRLPTDNLARLPEVSEACFPDVVFVYSDNESAFETTGEADDAGSLFEHGWFAQSGDACQRRFGRAPERAAFSQSLPCPVVVWLSSVQAGALNPAAVHLHRFPVDADDLTETLRTLETEHWVNTSGCTERERDARRRELQTLLALYRGLPTRDIPPEARLMDDIALLFYSNGRFAESEALVREALALCRGALPDEHPCITTCFDSLGAIYFRQNRFREAEPYMQEAIRRRRPTLDYRSTRATAEFTNLLNSLAILYFHRKQYADAEPLLLEALELGSTTLPAAHPGLATYHHNLAEIYRFQHRYDEAIPLYRQALAIARAASPANPKAPYYQRTFDLCRREQRRHEQNRHFLILRRRLANLFRPKRSLP